VLIPGFHLAEPGMEEGNLRARALYERLGYVAYGREPESRTRKARTDWPAVMKRWSR